MVMKTNHVSILWPNVTFYSNKVTPKLKICTCSPRFRKKKQEKLRLFTRKKLCSNR